MKKIILITTICYLTLLTGCKNPISSEVEKEGDETRQLMSAELALTKDEIYQRLTTELQQATQKNAEIMSFYAKYISTMVNPYAIIN